MARPSYPTTAMAKVTQNQLPAAADQAPREESINQGTESSVGVTFTGHERRQWRQTSRESATEEIRNRASERAAKALPPKEDRRRREEGGGEGDVYDGGSAGRGEAGKASPATAVTA